MKPIQVRLVGRFRLTSKIPGHHQHLLYQAIHTQTEDKLFLKGQQIKNKPAPNFLSILQQGKILQTMQGGIGVPHMYWCGQQQDYNFIVLQELQCNLNKLLQKCKNGNKFSLKSVLMFGEQAILILQYYHFKNFVHNHINPKHFMIGAGQKYGKWFLVDYSNSIRYRDAQTLQHIVQRNIQANNDKKQNNLHIRYINMQFSSIRYHKGLTPSRKDDLISFLYLMLYLIKGQLPWSHLMTTKKSQQQISNAILEMKQKIQPQKLFQGYNYLYTLYEYTLNLGFDQKPRYTYYKNIFIQRLQKQGFINDKIYDWYLIEDSEEDDEDIDLNFQVIPHEEQFIKQLGQQIKIRQNKGTKQTESSKDSTIQPKKRSSKNQKDCVIY